MAQNHEWRLNNQGSYTATQQDQAIGTVLVRVVIQVKSRE
jgi:hypothetical protein